MASKKSANKPKVYKRRGIFIERQWSVKSDAKFERLKRRNKALGIDVALAAAERKILRAAKHEGLILQGSRVDIPEVSDTSIKWRREELSDAYLAIRDARSSFRRMLEGEFDISTILALSSQSFQAGYRLARYEVYLTTNIKAKENLKRGGKQKVTDDQIIATVKNSKNNKDAARKLGINTKTISRRLSSKR